jgi:DNA-binding MarR family transcriptional regulator
MIQTEPAVGTLQVLILDAINRHPAITTPAIELELAVIIRVCQSAAYTAIKSLANQELIVPGEKHCRAVTYSITPKGRQRLEAMQRHYNAVATHLGATVAKGKIAT